MGIFFNFRLLVHIKQFSRWESDRMNIEHALMDQIINYMLYTEVQYHLTQGELLLTKHGCMLQ